MKYEKLLKHVTNQKIKNTGRWRGLLLNEETGAIFPASRYGMKEAKDKKIPYNEHSVSFFFMPKNICVLNYIPLTTYDLVPYGMSGRFESRKSIKSEHTYIHELFDKYEAYSGMRISMIDGKPLDARLLDDIKLNPEALAQFNERMEELKTAFFVLNRMNENVEPIQREWEERKNSEEKRRKLFIKLLSKPFPNDWAKKLMPFYSDFWHSSYSSKKDHNKIFDNMIRFDKAHLFRELGVIDSV